MHAVTQTQSLRHWGRRWIWDKQHVKVHKRLHINITAALPAKYEQTPAISYVGGLRQTRPQTHLPSALQSVAQMHPNVFELKHNFRNTPRDLGWLLKYEARELRFINQMSDACVYNCGRVINLSRRDYLPVFNKSRLTAFIWRLTPSECVLNDKW